MLQVMTMSGGAPPATAAAICSILIEPLIPRTWISGCAAFQASMIFSIALTSPSPDQQ